MEEVLKDTDYVKWLDDGTKKLKQNRKYKRIEICGINLC
jgi:hypothetical protein